MSNANRIFFFDAPQVLDCSVTPIPGSASLPLQVVASSAYPIGKILIDESIGTYVGLYTGLVGAEVLKCILASDDHQDVFIPSGTRISLRSMDSSSITVGAICCQFLDKV